MYLWRAGGGFNRQGGARRGLAGVIYGPFYAKIKIGRLYTCALQRQAKKYKAVVQRGRHVYFAP